MSKAMQLVGIILLGIFTLVIINLMSDVRSTSELDYYLAQEITEAAMYDAVDYAYYRNTGLLKVDRDMFLENFNRRFATSVDNNRNYEISIVDFNEVPPKVSVEIKANTVSTIKGENAVINVKVSGILETIYDDLVMSRGQYEEITSLDVKAPTIDKSFDGKSFNITISDSESHLDKFCYVYLDKEVVAASANLISSGQTCDNSVFGKSSANFSHSEYVDNDYNEWIVVYDISGNTTWEPLTNETKPWVAKVKYESENLSFTLKGFSKITDYYISIDEPTINNSNWKKVPNNNEINNVWTTTVNINNFLREQAKDGEHTYYIFGRDINGIITKPRSIKILRNLGSSPQIDSIDFVSNENNLYLKMSDIDGDLSKYLIKKDDDSKPSANADWINVKNGYVETIQENIESRGSGTYYIWVKDDVGNITSTNIKISVFSIVYNVVGDLKSPRTLNINVNSDDFGWMEISIKLPNGTVENKKTSDKSYSIQLNKHGSWTISTKVFNKDGNLLTVGNRFPDNQFVKSYDMDLNYVAPYHYVCSKGSPKPNNDKKCVGTDTDTKPYTYSCESGYTKDGNSCYKTETKDAKCTRVCREGSTDFQGTCIKKYSSQSQEQCHKNGPNYYFDGTKKECWVKEDKICNYSCNSGGKLNGSKCTYTVTINATKDSTPEGYTDNGKEWVKNTPYEINANYVPYCPSNSGTLNNNITPPMCEF